MYVAPSILSADFGRLDEEIQAICQAGCDLVHVDVMDGHFVPNLTIGPVVVKSVAKCSTKPLDVHLMVQNPSFFVDLFAPLAPKFITFHLEAEKHPHRLVQKIRSLGISPGIVLNPHSRVEDIEYLLESLDLVLLMSVNPGFGGQEFLPLVLEKSARLRRMIDLKDLKVLIEVDGGVNGLNIHQLEEAGVDIVVAGSYVFGSSSYKTAIESLQIS